MTTAKAEIANYSIATRFGKGKRIYHDKKFERPQTPEESIRQIEDTFRHNGWDSSDEARNALLVGLEAKSVGEYSNEELKIILGDFEKRGMIIYENM